MDLNLKEKNFGVNIEKCDLNNLEFNQKFFDKINPFEEIADDRAIGKLTEALVQIGVPGGLGFKMGQKLASKAMSAKRKGKYLNLKNPNLQKAVGKAGDLNKKAKFKLEECPKDLWRDLNVRNK